jgi:hypothetical protein
VCAGCPTKLVWDPTIVLLISTILTVVHRNGFAIEHAHVLKPVACASHCSEHCPVQMLPLPAQSPEHRVPMFSLFICGRVLIKCGLVPRGLQALQSVLRSDASRVLSTNAVITVAVRVQAYKLASMSFAVDIVNVRTSDAGRVQANRSMVSSPRKLWQAVLE